MARTDLPARFTDEERLRNSPVTRDDATRVRFTDEEAAFLRHARFGELPAPVLPDEMTATVELDPPQEDPYRTPFLLPHHGG